MNPEITAHIEDLIDRGAMFYCSHSGGKDSQTMFIELKRIVPASQLVVIHADLPGVVWEGEQDHIRNTIGDTPFIVCRAKKTFMDMVNHRGMFPAPKYRQCTSDLKRDPINKVIRADLKERGLFLAVNCIGIRAEESPGRAKQKPFKLNARMSKAGREVYDMHPIFDYLLADVWKTILIEADQEGHWAYLAGMTRLSCCFCIMASSADLRTAAGLNPDLYREYVEKEKELGFTMRHGMTLPEITGMDLPEMKGDCI